MPDNTRTRLRKNRLPIRDGDTAEESRTRIAKRVIDFYANDLSKGGVDRELRLQRIAKFRMWTEGKTWPFDNASDIALPDMMEKSLRVQDTLHNAVMSQMPVVGAKADDEEDASKEDVVDDLIHHQVFSEQEGETFIANLIADLHKVIEIVRISENLTPCTVLVNVIPHLVCGRAMDINPEIPFLSRILVIVILLIPIPITINFYFSITLTQSFILPIVLVNFVHARVLSRN